MLITINKFKTAILEKDELIEPFFPENVSYSCEKFQDHFVVSVYGHLDQIDGLKQKYEWLGQNSVNMDDASFQ